MSGSKPRQTPSTSFSARSETFSAPLHARMHARRWQRAEREKAEKDRRREKDLKADETRPTQRARTSIVKFSYKFLLDVNSKTAAGRPNKASRKSSRDETRAAAWLKEGVAFETAYPLTLTSSPFPTGLYLGRLLLLLIPVRLTVRAAEKLVLLVSILPTFSLSYFTPSPTFSPSPRFYSFLFLPAPSPL